VSNGKGIRVSVVTMVAMFICFLCLVESVESQDNIISITKQTAALSFDRSFLLPMDVLVAETNINEESDDDHSSGGGSGSSSLQQKRTLTAQARSELTEFYNTIGHEIDRSSHRRRLCHYCGSDQRSCGSCMRYCGACCNCPPPCTPSRIGIANGVCGACSGSTCTSISSCTTGRRNTDGIASNGCEGWVRCPNNRELKFKEYCVFLIFQITKTCADHYFFFLSMQISFSFLS
jgi:hypothetical protein